MQHAIGRATEKGLQYLATAQHPDGSFISYLSSDPTRFEAAPSIWTTFTPSLILAALSPIKKDASRIIRQKIAAFLLAEKNELWSFNYWAHKEMQKHTTLYPDDLDDTFAALIGLYLHDPASITPEALVAMTKILIATESQVGGPYKTWLALPDSAKEWLDIDLVVNSNVAFFLSLVSKTPPNLRTMLSTAVSQNQLSSPYYPSAYQVAYFIARNQLPADTAKLLINRLRQLQNEAPPDHIRRALLVSSLIRVGAPAIKTREHINILLRSQHEDGSWAAGTIYVNHHTDTATFYAGSAALTTAFVLESMALYADTIQKPLRKIIAETKPITSDTHLQATIQEKIKEDSRELRQPLQNALRTSLAKLLQSSNGLEVIAFATHFNTSLVRPLKHGTNFLTNLGMANAYGWTAYTIYDDLMDDEGTPLFLPTANVALRLSYEGFLHALPNNRDFTKFVRQTFNRIDTANAWELTHCRFDIYKKGIAITDEPDYGDLSLLADRSLGHTLSPLAVLAARGYKVNGTNFQAISSALKHYIIAKQLNDDAHDWQEDIQGGRITYVVTTILTELAAPNGYYTIKALLPVMQKQFWHHTIIVICDEMQHQVDLGRQALAQAPILKRDNNIVQLLNKIEKSIQETRMKQSEAITFLKYFGDEGLATKP